MRKTIIWAVILVLVLIAYPFLNKSENREPLTGLPWQINLQPDGSTQVFGIHIGASRLSDALDILGDDMELAIIAAADETGSLEMYYGHYQAGLLSGKLILTTSTSEGAIKFWRENAISSDYVATGRAKKYILSANDVINALNEIITGLTFIPAVNLDEKVIRARFGDPDERTELVDVIHFIYEHKGLDIALYPDAKDIFQYVSPNVYRK